MPRSSASLAAPELARISFRLRSAAAVSASLPRWAIRTTISFSSMARARAVAGNFASARATIRSHSRCSNADALSCAAVTPMRMRVRMAGDELLQAFGEALVDAAARDAEFQYLDLIKPHPPGLDRQIGRQQAQRDEADPSTMRLKILSAADRRALKGRVPRGCPCLPSPPPTPTSWFEHDLFRKHGLVQLNIGLGRLVVYRAPSQGFTR